MPPNASTNPETPSTTGQAPTPIEVATPPPATPVETATPVEAVAPRVIDTADIPGPTPEAQPRATDTPFANELTAATVISTPRDKAKLDQDIMGAAAEHLTRDDAVASPPSPETTAQP